MTGATSASSVDVPSTSVPAVGSDAPEIQSGRATRPTSPPAAGDAWEAALGRTPKKGIQITAGAAAYGKEKLAKRGTPQAAIRLGIKGGGCSGFGYVIQFEDGEPRSRDYAYEVAPAEGQDAIRFVVDKKSLIYLAGSIFDYEKTLMFQGFKFRNPNEASSCGCGHSFTVK